MVFLASVGSTAPFIGLFGTVWGIMHSFSAIAASKNTSLAVVAPGIAEALFATAIGLVAAIPAVLAYNKISTDLARFAARLEGFGTEFGAILSRQSEERAEPWRCSSAAAARAGRYRPLAEINVTPLVDVMLVLLVIFMITAPLMTSGVNVDLPKASASRSRRRRTRSPSASPLTARSTSATTRWTWPTWWPSCRRIADRRGPPHLRARRQDRAVRPHDRGDGHHQAGRLHQGGAAGRADGCRARQLHARHGGADGAPDAGALRAATAAALRRLAMDAYRGAGARLTAGSGGARRRPAPCTSRCCWRCCS